MKWKSIELIHILCRCNPAISQRWHILKVNTLAILYKKDIFNFLMFNIIASHRPKVV